MSELDFIRNTLHELEEFVREKYATRATVDISSKSQATDLLTEVDLAVQQRAAERVAAAYPNDIFIAEEEGLGRIPHDPNSRCWVMDPIDGTQNFVRGLFPTFGISLAFAVGGAVAAGGVSLPIPGDLFLAERGAGTFRNGARVHTTDINSLDLAWIDVDLGGPRGRKPIYNTAADIIDRAGAVRCYCAAVVGLCSVACGELDGYVHIGLNPWDFAAGQILVEEAGGRTSCLDGSPLKLFGPKNGVVATNGPVHDELLAALRLA